MTAIVSVPSALHGASESDPIVVELVAGALRAAMTEMGTLIERTAMSAFIREKKDYQCAVFDRNAERVDGTVFVAVNTDMVHPILQTFPPEEMRPGDIYWYNDCYLSQGAVSHSNDQVFVRPIFFEGTLVAYIQAWAHFNDIGGMVPGSISPDATEIFQEGIIVPPVRLMRDSVLNDDVLRVFSRNCRFPRIVRGDVRTLVAAVVLGERRIAEIFDRLGAESVANAFEQLIRRTGTEAVRRAHERFPEGTYEFTQSLGRTGPSTESASVTFKMDVTAEHIKLDARKSSDQSRAPINFIMAPEGLSVMLSGLLLGGDARFPVNAGAKRVLDEALVREQSLLAPVWPAALGQRSMTVLQCCFGAFLGLFAEATGGKSPAAHSSYVILSVEGSDEVGDFFLFSDPLGIGYGARPFSDGHDGVYMVANENYPVEFVEANYPLHVHQYALAADSGGPGTFRGGCGVIREIEILAKSCSLAVRMENPEFPPWGLSGGKSGRPGYCVLNPGTEGERLIAPNIRGLELRRGDVVRVVTPGGGGWGHPFDRPAATVLGDVLAGTVTRDAAFAEYGVVLTDADDLDFARTVDARSRRFPTSLFHRNVYLDHL